MATTTTTSIGPAIPTEILDPLVMSSLRQSTFLPMLVRNVDISGISGLKYDFNSFSAVSAGAKVQGTDFTPVAQTIAEDGTVTAAEIGVAIDLADIAREAAPYITELDYAREIAGAVADKLETDIAATFASASGSVGTTTASLTIADFEAAVFALRVAKAPSTPQPNSNLPAALAGYQSVLSERQVADLAAALRAAGIPTLPANVSLLMENLGAVAANSARFSYLGVPVYGSTVLGTANDAADSVGAMFAPAAIGLVFKRAPRVESERHALGSSARHVATAVYGTGMIKGAFIQKIVTRATA